MLQNKRKRTYESIDCSSYTTDIVVHEHEQKLHLKQVQHFKNELTAIERITKHNSNRPKLSERQRHINCKSEHDRVLVELSRTNIQDNVKQKRKERHRNIKQVYNDREFMNIYIYMIEIHGINYI